MYKRSLKLPEAGTESFFLWGPRQVGKSTLLRQTYPDGHWLDLLKNEEYQRYTTRPERLRLELEELSPTSGFQVVIDEIQNVPALLNEVHWLIENRGTHFALCASSARNLRRGGINLLGGRALRYELLGLTSGELGKEFDLGRLLNHGYMPRMYASNRPRRLVDAYVADYLRQEIANEARIQSLPMFSNFLEAAALRDGAIVNFTNIGRETGVSYKTVKSYFNILVDTLLGRWLPAYRKLPKGRETASPKFYFADAGIVNHLAKRGEVIEGSQDFGKAFENWVFHELSAFLSYRQTFEDLSHWRLPSGIEVDFLVGSRLAVEARARPTITRNHLKGLRALRREHPDFQRLMVVCLEAKPWRTEDGIDVVPAEVFAERLWAGELL